MTTCQTCDASYSNTMHRIFVRCGTCVFQDGKPPTNWRQAVVPAARYGETHHTGKHTCPLCDAQPGQEHAPACPRHPSDPMGVRRVPHSEMCQRCLRDGWVERESECKKHGPAGVAVDRHQTFCDQTPMDSEK